MIAEETFNGDDTMSRKIAITTESAADISAELQKRYDIHVMPMTVLIGDEEYKDGVDLTTTELFEKSKLYSSVPKTSGISPHEYKLVFETLTEKGYDVVHVALGSKISSCFQNALFAANSLENVFVVDSESLSAGTAMLAFSASSLRKSGEKAAEIAKRLEAERKRISTSFVLEDTDFLLLGGRCKKGEKLLSDLLSLKPTIDITDGELVPGKRFRGKGLEAMKKYIAEKLSSDIDRRVCLLNYTALSSGEVNELCAFAKAQGGFESVIAEEAGCCIASHCGERCMGIIFKQASG